MVKVARCEVCGAVIDPEDPDFKENVDHPELCGECNEAYKDGL